MTFDQWLESYAPTAPERLDDCVKAAWSAATLAEREACAKVCDQEASVKTINGSMDYNTGREMGATVCGHAIRARKE